MFWSGTAVKTAASPQGSRKGQISTSSFAMTGLEIQRHNTSFTYLFRKKGGGDMQRSKTPSKILSTSPPSRSLKHSQSCHRGCGPGSHDRPIFSRDLVPTGFEAGDRIVLSLHPTHRSWRRTPPILAKGPRSITCPPGCGSILDLSTSSCRAAQTTGGATERIYLGTLQTASLDGTFIPSLQLGKLLATLRISLCLGSLHNPPQTVQRRDTSGSRERSKAKPFGRRPMSQ